MLGPISLSDGPTPGDLGICRIAQEQVHPGIPEPRHSGQVGRPVIKGQLVEFDVAGVQHRAGAGMHRDG